MVVWISTPSGSSEFRHSRGGEQYYLHLWLVLPTTPPSPLAVERATSLLLYCIPIPVNDWGSAGWAGPSYVCIDVVLFVYHLDIYIYRYITSYIYIYISYKIWYMRWCICVYIFVLFTWGVWGQCLPPALPSLGRRVAAVPRAHTHTLHALNTQTYTTPYMWPTRISYVCKTFQ